MASFLNNSVNSDRQFLAGLMVGSYVLSFVISFIGAFPIGFPSPSLSVFLEATFTIFAIYSALASAWIFYLDAAHTPHIKTFVLVSFLIIVGTSLLLISANFYLQISPHLRAAAVLIIGITPLFIFATFHEIFSKTQPGQRDIIYYLLSMALFLFSWGIHTALQPFWLPNILEIALLSIVAITYNVVALVGLFLAIQLVRQEGSKLRFFLLPSLAYVVIGVSIGLYLQRNEFESFRLFEMIISEPWRWAIGYNMPLFSKTFNFIFYLIFPAAVLPLGWSILKQTYKTRAPSWQNILFGWVLLFVCGASSSDTFEIIGKLIGYSLLLFGFLGLLSIEKSLETLHKN